MSIIDMPRQFVWLWFLLLLAGCRTLPPSPVVSPPFEAPSVVSPANEEASRPHKIALVLGGGAAKGFAHVGVIKGLEAAGIEPDIIVGTSAGSIVGVLYAAGYTGTELEKLSLHLEESQLTDWSLPNRGVIKGAALQDFINKAVQYRPLERLNRPVAVVTTDLHSGEMVVFRSGDSGMAVRASSAVPGVFQPVMIDSHEYVDGGLVSPVPINVARTLGADFIIAVDISKSPESNKIESYVEVMMQSYIIMGQTIRRYELPGADIVIRPDMLGIGGLNFKGREHAILAGEKAALAIMPGLKVKLEKLRSAH